MIIWACYTMGKTSFVHKHQNECVDNDWEYYFDSKVRCERYRSDVYHYAKDKIVFINSPVDVIDPKDVDIAFIPKSMKIVIDRLIKREEDPEFIMDMKDWGEAPIADWKKAFDNIIVLEKDEYVSDYEELIMTKFKESICKKSINVPLVPGDTV